MKNIKKIIVYSIPMLMLFVLQAILAVAGSYEIGFSITILLLMVIYPLGFFLSSLYFSKKHGVNLYFIILLLIMFNITAFYMYKDLTALLTYSCIYFVAGLIGCILGLPKQRVLTKTIVFDAPIEKVYNTVTNNADWQYRTGLDDLKIIETNGEFEHWEETTNGVTIRFTTTKKTPYTLYSFAMDSKLFKGSWCAEFEEIDKQKTLFSATESIEYTNPFVKTLAYMFLDLDKYMETYQNDLLQKLKQS